MRIRLKYLLSSLASVSVLLPSAAFASLVFNTFVNGTDITNSYGNSSPNQTIGFAYAGNKFVGSVYGPSANNNQLYTTDLNGQNVQSFGAPLPFTSNAGEIYVSASLGIGGYGPRDVFSGSEFFNTVYKTSNNGATQSPFVTLPPTAQGIKCIAFDPYGLYGNSMIVSTRSGEIYKVSNSGVATLLANIGVLAEGMTFTTQPFGPYPKGTLLVASEVSGKITTVTPAGAVTTVVSDVPGAEMISFVPSNIGASGNPLEGLYEASWPNDVKKVGTNDLLAFIGTLIVTSETTSDIWSVSYDPILNVFKTSISLGKFPGQPEDGILITADIINPAPEPGTILLAASAILSLALARRRVKQSGLLPSRT